MSIPVSFKIVYDKPQEAYLAGENVSCNIILETSELKLARGIKVSIKGEAYTHFKRGKHRYVARENYFSNTVYVIGHSEGNNDVEIPRGTHIYPFTFTLPQDLPCSFEHYNGYVRYTVKAAVDIAWAIDWEVKSAFTVVNTLDLNDFPEQCRAIDVDVGEKYYSCLCCFYDGELTGNITSPYSGYVPGQPMHVNFSFDMKSDSIDVDKIVISLTQKINIYSKSRTFTKTDKNLILENINRGPFRKNDVLNYRFTIPPIPPSELRYCKLIDIFYQLTICVTTTGWHEDIVKKFPILIGTNPLAICSEFLPSAPPAEISVPTDTLPSAPTAEEENVPSHIGDPSSNYSDPCPPYEGADRPSELIGLLIPKPPSSSNRQQWETPPPTYAECTMGTFSIVDEDDSANIIGANAPFSPKYPVFNFNEMPPPKD